MSLLLDIFGFLSVVLRGLILTAQSFTLGGVAFFVLLALPLADHLGTNQEEITQKCSAFLRCAAIALALLTLLALILNAAVLIGTLQIVWMSALGAGFVKALTAVVLCSVFIGFFATPERAKKNALLLVVAALILLSAQVSATHAVSRLGERSHLIVSDLVHMLGAAVWIGGLPYLLIVMNRIHDGAQWREVSRRYSLMSMVSVGAIALSGTIMGVSYIGSIEAIYGTTYGIMVSTKALLLCLLLFLGSMNYLTVESLRRDPATPVLRLKRFAEVEIGIGLTVLFAAASLTSLPPGEDLTQDRASLTEISDRLTPQWPIRLVSPDYDKLAIPMLEARIVKAEAEKTTLPLAFVPGEGIVPPRNTADIAWSEYNHHWAGIFVALIGFLALIEHAPWGRWARHWPVLFLVMAGFLFLRSDPEVWPLGQIGFFDSLRDPEVVQHKVFVSLITLFGLFEWCVRTGNIAHPKAALVFPLITALGGMLMLTHSHALANIKDQLLIEISHVPLALSGIIAGWARWLELRLDGRASCIASWVWPVAFVMVGFILLSYREA